MYAIRHRVMVLWGIFQIVQKSIQIIPEAMFIRGAAAPRASRSLFGASTVRTPRALSTAAHCQGAPHPPLSLGRRPQRRERETGEAALGMSYASSSAHRLDLTLPLMASFVGRCSAEWGR